MRALLALPLVLFVAAVALACGGDDSSNGGNSPTQPSSCGSPCTPGALCYQPDPSSSCNGDWYCWSDTMWHCAPPDSGGPGDATVDFDTGLGGDDAGEESGDEQPVMMMGDAEAGVGGG
ncbi:MAG TPA: hypothetical protein VGL81_24670 [Polyangiaceae bacterium]